MLYVGRNNDGQIIAVSRKQTARTTEAVQENDPDLTDFLALAREEKMRSALATTDADCRVGPNWGPLTLAALSRADVACGRIVPDPLEFARLPALVRSRELLLPLQVGTRTPKVIKRSIRKMQR